MYLLVEFTDTKEVAVVPENWLDGTACAVWPTHIRASSKLTSAVMQKMEPGENWPSFPIKELYRSGKYLSLSLFSLSHIKHLTNYHLIVYIPFDLRILYEGLFCLHMKVS
jgi:hypothetical protein